MTNSLPLSIYLTLGTAFDHDGFAAVKGRSVTLGKTVVSEIYVFLQ